MIKYKSPADMTPEEVEEMYRQWLKWREGQLAKELKGIRTLLRRLKSNKESKGVS